MDQNISKGTALALAAALISGVSVFINGVAVKLADPLAYTILKNAGAFILVAGLVLALGEAGRIARLSRRQLGILAIIGVVGGSVPFAMFFYGLSLGGAAVSSFIYRSLFVFAGVFGYLVLREVPKPRDMAAGFAILIGNALLVSGDAIFSTGQLLVLGATILWALEYTISRRALADISPRTLMASRMLFGSIILVSFAALTGSLGSFAQVSAPVAGWLVLTSILLAAFMAAWYSALRHLPVLTAASILALGGVVTAALDLLFVGSPLSFPAAAGLALIAAGAASACGMMSAVRAAIPGLRAEA